MMSPVIIYLQINSLNKSTSKRMNLKWRLSVLLMSLLILIPFQSAKSEISLAMTGYIFNLSSYSYIKENRFLGIFDTPSESSLSDLVRARIRPTLHLDENTRIEAQYEVNGIISNKNMFVMTEISENKRQIVKLAQNIHTDTHTVINHYLDRFFIKQIFDFGELSVGRQRVSWGVGRIWQPTDLFNPLNPANFSKIEKDGADVVSAKVYIGNFTDLEIVYNPTMSIYHDNYGARFRTNYKEYDLSLMTGYFDGTYVVGGDFAGNLSDAGFRGEFVYSAVNENVEQDFLKFILGLDYQFSENIYGLIEYQHNGQGTNYRNQYDFVSLLKGDILNVGTNYIALNANYRLNDLTNIGFGNISNINDSSGFFNISGIYQISQSWQFNLTAMLTYGSKGSEYRLYPYAVYMITEWFF